MMIVPMMETSTAFLATKWMAMTMTKKRTMIRRRSEGYIGRCITQTAAQHQLPNGGRLATAATPQSTIHTTTDWYVDPITGCISKANRNDNGKKNNTNDTKSAAQKNSSSFKPIYQVIVGLEVHVQLNHCPTKLFSAARLHHTHHLPQSQSESSTTPTSHSHHQLTPSPSQQQQQLLILPPNTVPAMHPYDVGVPGILPIISVSAIRYALLMAGLLQCQTIHTISRFERKHYTYSDLPLSYQITQQQHPIATQGLLQCERKVVVSSDNNKNNSSKSRMQQQQPTSTMIQCRINRIQLEQDTAKTTSITKQSTTTSSASTIATYSRVDMNRAGIPLCEIVTEPDLRSAVEASTIVTHLRQLLQYTHISSALMQLGQLRVDCNVNVIPVVNDDDDNLNDHDCNDGTSNTNNDGMNSRSSSRRKHRMRHPRVEVKNLNSIQQIEDCIQYEAYRQVKVLEQIEGEQEQSDNRSIDDVDHNENVVISTQLREETRTYNAIRKRTELLRYKDQVNDYRFLPELDLPPCVINRTVLQDCTTISEFIQKFTPILPNVIQQQLVHCIGISSEQANVIVTNHPEAVQFFRESLLYALSFDGVESDNRNNDPAATSRRNELQQDHRSSFEEIAKTYPAIDLQRAANEIANLQCNVLFHLVKEQYRSKLLHQQPQHKQDNEYDDDTMPVVTMDQLPISAQQLGEIVHMILSEQISNTMAKQLIHILCSTEYATTTASPRQVAQERNFKLITNLDTLRELCTTTIVNHPDEILVYHKGGKYKMKMEKLFVGKVMSVTNGNAHPERLRDVVIDCLSKTTASSTATI